jgi:hypothetical protein
VTAFALVAPQARADTSHFEYQPPHMIFAHIPVKHTALNTLAVQPVEIVSVLWTL